jgi:hypothetical protein
MVSTCSLRGWLLLACAAAAGAQPPSASTTTPSQTLPQPAGLEADWDIAPVLQQIGSYAARLAPALDKLDPQVWASKGASETYLRQLQSCKEQARALADQSKALMRYPEKLSASLEVLFRIHGLDTMLSSLVEGARRYESPGEADALEALAVQDGASRDRLQGYIVNLATEREHDLDVMDREAQRCRGLAIQTPAKPVRKP